MNGDQLRTLRARLKLTQKQLAELLQVNSVTVAKWEAGTLPILRVTQLAIEHLTCKPKRLAI